MYKPSINIISEPRTGSTLMTRLLTSHPEATVFDEPYNIHMMLSDFSETPRFGTAEELMIYCSEQNKYWGFKNHHYSSLDGALIGGKPNRFHNWWKLLSPDTATIITLRRNVVKQYVSWLKARNFGQWHRPKEKPVNSRRVWVAPNQLIQKVNFWSERCRKTLELWPNAKVVYYEDWIDDIEAAWQMWIHYFSLPKIDMPEIKTGKTGRPLPEVVENYEQLKKELSGTKLEKFLDEE